MEKRSFYGWYSEKGVKVGGTYFYQRANAELVELTCVTDDATGINYLWGPLRNG